MVVVTNVAHASPGDSAADPIIITTVQQLSDIRNNLSKHYKLGADIDLTGYVYPGDSASAGWLPIDGTPSFTGTLDGNGYAIRNMTINRPSLAWVGLFGRIGTGSKLIGIRLLNINVTGSESVGGLVGNVVNGTILNSYAAGSVSTLHDNAGGLVGINASGTIQNSYAVCNVSGWTRIGGLVGTNAGTIKNSYAVGNVNGNDTIGGLVGYNLNASGKVQNSYAVGHVTGSSSVGGLVGRQDSGGTTTSSYWNIETSGLSVSAGGAGVTGETTAQMQTLSAYTGLDFDNVWGIREGETYPYLLAFKPGIAADPLAVTMYNLSPGQDELSVTGTVYDNSIGEQVTVGYAIKNSFNITVTSVTYNVYADGSAQSINRTILLAGLSDGVYTLNITAKDTYNPSETLSPLSFTIDQTAPVVTGVIEGSSYNADKTISFNEGTATLDGAAFSSGSTVSAEGNHTLVVTDAAGNSSTVHFTIDQTAPVVTGVIDSGSYNADKTISFNEGTATLDNAAFSSGSTVSAEGNHTLVVTDAAGNSTTIRFSINHPESSMPAPPSASASPKIDLSGLELDPASIDIKKPSVTLEVTPKDGVAYVSIPASILTSFEDKNAAFFIEIKAPYGSYQVPVNLASLIPGLKDLLAANNLKAEDISFKITLTDKSENKEIQTAFANGLPNGKALGSIVDFNIEIMNTKTGKAIGTADKFSKALTRVIPVPKNLNNLPEQWGAFRYNETTKKFEFVAAKKVQIEGVWYVMINSYSNSTYVVAENVVSFTDVQKHWGQPYVQLAAARGLVVGVGGGLYDPDKAVTRAEFAAMLVRALGRGTSTDTTAAPYDDVKSGAWYFGEVSKAKEFGLLGFVKGKSFMPDQPLTREEMASVLAAVITLEKLSITKELVSLDGYKDIGNVTAGYLEDVRMMVKLKIMTGTGADTFSPKGETTRAQAATVFIRTLQALGMID
jgi:hypothetical protein